jgi:EmrB/QacA subfamily drug resistance transporter
MNTARASIPVSPNILLWLVAIAVFMETLDSTIVNTALPTIARSLGENPLQMYAIIIAYSLTLAVLIPATGWMADRFGTRRIFMTAVTIFTLGSMTCAASQNLVMLVAARVLQGIGGSMMLPVGRLAVLRAFPNEKYLNAISFVAIPGLIGPLIGPTLGGWIVEYASWHWIFLLNVPVGLAGIIYTHKYMPDFRNENSKPFDFTGFAMLSLGMVGISVSLDGFSELGWAQSIVIVMVAFSLAALTSYWLHASRNANALFSLRLFDNDAYRIGLLGNLFARIGSGSMPFLIPTLLQLSIGYSPAQAGMMMIPVAFMSIASKRIVQGLIHRYSYRRFLMLNTIFLGSSIASFAFVSPFHPAWVTALQLAVFGMVNSLQFTAMNSLTLKDVPAQYASQGNSLYSMVQMLSMSLGTAAAGALLTAFAQLHGEKSSTSADAFFKTFITMGLVTCASAWIFAQLSPRIKAPVKEQTVATLH